MLVGLEGAACLIAAVVLLVRGITGADRHIVNGFGTAAWFGIIGAVVAAAAWALWTGRRWGRGIAVFTQLLLLPVTWYMGVGSHRWIYGVPIAAVALAALVLLFSHSSAILVPSAINTLYSLRNFCCVNDRMYLFCAFESIRCKTIIKL